MPHLIGFLALAVLNPAPMAARADDHTPSAPPAATAPAQPEPTPLSELDVVAKPKPNPTPLSEVDVVATRKPPTSVSGVEVRPPVSCLPPRKPVDQEAPAPRLVSSYPADGQTVKPGYAVLRLTFDLPMACRGSLPQNLVTACFADGIEIWHESFDRKSLMIVCDLKAGSHYEVAVNRRIPEHFQGLSGREPDEGRFSFDTTDEPPVRTAADLADRDPVLAYMLLAASRPGGSATGSRPRDLAQAEAANVSVVKVQETNRCLQPRHPPDPEVPAPRLVSTFPAQGQTVRPGLIEVRFTFDLPMACVGGVEIKEGNRNPCSDLETQHWSQPWDRHSMRFRCRIEPGRRYTLLINKAREFVDHPPWPKFKGLGGKPADPFELTFTVSNDAPVQTEAEADEQDPLMKARLDGRRADRED